MLQIEIISVGKIKFPWIQEGIDHYRKLLSKYAELKLTSVKEADSATQTPAQVLEIEAERISKAIAPRSYVLLLDVQGKRLSSEQFSALISHIKQGSSHVHLVVGGAFGLSDELKQQYKDHISLSAMTFPHELTLVVLLEQLYRACSIEAGSKYHK
ncbi:MAG: 23S rRNA (pseudouridine(1915)-N(3))-methyltransferase RlmH [bacterium]|nr:23S rRNA (pseudouridine(1915)-N(3))-methyltransferase RlmH [bacterium]